MSIPKKILNHGASMLSIPNAWKAMNSRGKSKVFCIGCNKTGTTSLQRALLDMGYVFGEQRQAELLAAEDWATRDFRRLIRYCQTAQAFQDAPFSFPFTYQAMDAAFPGSKFILTIRSSVDDWYESLTRFHAKMWSQGRVPPTQDDLKQALYRRKGWAWIINRALFDTPEIDPYMKSVLVDYYEGHNASVREYFRHRPTDLLILNVAADGAYTSLCDFLHIHCEKGDFPWENKT